jgi:hypothetical protein
MITSIADPALEITPQSPCMTVADGMIWQFEHDRILGRSTSGDKPPLRVVSVASELI